MLKESRKKTMNNNNKKRLLVINIVMLLIILILSSILVMFSNNSYVKNKRTSDKESISAMTRAGNADTEETSNLKFYKSSEAIDITAPSFNGKQYVLTNTYNGPVITAEKTVKVVEQNELKEYEGYVVGTTELEYTITAINNGEVEKKDLLIQDTIPAGLTFVNNSIRVNGNYDYKSTDLREKTENDLSEGIMVDVPGKIGDTAGQTKLSFRVIVNELEGEDNLHQTIKNIATVEENKPEVTVDVKKAKIIIGKSAVVNETETRKTVEKDDRITYTIKVENTGEATENVTVIDTVPEGTVYVADTAKIIDENNQETPILIEDLAAGNVKFDVDAHTIKKVSFTVKVTGNDSDNNELADSTKIRNVATVNEEETTPTEHTYIKPIIKQEKKVTKQDGSKIENPNYVLEGDKIKYTIVVTNEGSKEKEVIVKDTIPEGLSFNAEAGIEITGTTTEGSFEQADLESGIAVTVPAKTEIIAEDGTKTQTNGKVEISFIVSVDELPEGTFTKVFNNVATVDEVETNRTETTVNKPDLQVEKTSNPADGAKVKVGDEITYTIKLDNSRGTAPTTATVSDNAPKGTIFKDVAKVMKDDVEENNYTEENLKDGIEVDLLAGEIKTVVFTVVVGDEVDVAEEDKLVDGRKISNTAKVNERNTNTTEHQYIEPIITVKKEMATENGLNYVVKNERVTYKITVENAGGLEKEVTVQDTISDKLTLDANSVIVKVNGTETVTEKDIETGIRVTVPAKVDETNGKVEVTFDATVKADAIGEIKNTAIIDEKETEEVKAPIVTFEKLATIVRIADSELGIAEGKVTKDDEIIYKVRVTNSGTENANNITITDIVPEGTELKQGTISDEGTTEDNQNISWNISSLAVGETKELRFTVVVTESEEERTIENTAIVSGEPTNTVTTEVELLTKLTIKYLEKETNNEIAEGKTKILKANTSYDCQEDKKEIDDYVFVEAVNVSGEIGTEPIEVIFYYVHKSAGVIVEHIDIDSDGTPLITETIEGNEGTPYTTSKADTTSGVLAGYELIEVPENFEGEMTKDVIKVQYYYRYPTNVIVKYIDQKTKESLVEQDISIAGYKGENYITERKEFDKYELVTVPENAEGKMTKEPITVIYEYLKKKTSVEVRHYDIDTNAKVSESHIEEGRIDDEYTTTPAEEIVNNENSMYELVSTRPTDKDGNEIDPTVIMTEEKIIVTYYYRIKTTTLVVNYLEKDDDDDDTNNLVLLDPVTTEGKVGESYTQTADRTTIEKDGKTYTLVDHTENLEGNLSIEPTVITFYYLQNTRVIVNHIDKTTGEVIETLQKPGLVGDEYTSTSKNFEGYILVESPENENVIMTKDEIVLNYYYEAVNSGVIEKHIDIITGEVLHNETHEGKVGDPYDIKSKEFEGYDLVEDRLPANSKGVMAAKEIEVIYYYKHRSNVTAKYIDRATGEELVPEERQDGYEGDKYTTERKQIDEYVLTKVPENADGTMTKEPTTVTYIYAHITGGVIERHIDIKTGKQLVPEQKFEGYEGDSYKTEPENIPYYDLVKEQLPENAEGKMTVETIIVNYYYIKQSEVIVKYVDKTTGKSIVPEEKIPGHEGDKYKTEEKEIPGYKLVKVPDNKEGTMTGEATEVIYEYVRPAEVVVNYIDIETNKPIETQETINGYEGDKYETTAKVIKYYKLEKTPGNAQGTMKVEVAGEEVNKTTYVNYYYRKLNFNLSVNKIIKDITINGRTLTINGDLGKVEVYRKEINSAKVQIRYTIKVTNNGELTGKAKLLENIPSGTKMAKANNSEWTIGTTSATLDTAEIKPGESKEYTVVLDWANSENNLGMQKNVVEILSSNNEAGFADSDKSDNTDSAELIVTVSTGEITYVAILGVILVILAGTTIILVKKNKKEE